MPLRAAEQPPNPHEIAAGRRVSSLDDAGKRFRRRGTATGDVLALLAAEPRRGRLLDLPAGDGISAQMIAELGFDVVPGDLFPESYRFDSPPCIQLDMRRPFPLEDESFDYVVCQEGIEHIESPLAFTKECARILKPGGKLILTTPNVLHMSARLSYFLNGHRTLRSGLINEYQTAWAERDGEDIYHGHAWHWRYHVLRYILRLSGFRVQKPRCAKYSLFSIVLSIPFFPALYLAHRVSVRAGLKIEPRRNIVDAARVACDEIGRHVLSRPVLWGKRLIVIGEKDLSSIPSVHARGEGSAATGP